MKNVLVLSFTTLTIVGLLWGCAQLQTKVGPEAAKAINTYCLQPQAARLVLREQVNALIAPNEVKITCQGDVQ